MKIISSHLSIDKKEIFAIEQHLYQYIDFNVNLPPDIKAMAFPDRFTEERMHLIMPTFFSEMFGVKSRDFKYNVSIAGFLL